MFEEAVDEWQTPKGAPAVFEYRQGTIDWGVIESTLTKDEYRLSGLSLSGYAFDIGAYIGSVAIGLALDNPGLRVVAVEPVPENVQLCRANVERNGLGDRVCVVDGAVGSPEEANLRIYYGYVDPQLGLQYAFVGDIGTVMRNGIARSRRVCSAKCYSLSDLVDLAGELPSFVKIDCEGGEWAAFSDPVTTRLPRIHGEWHWRTGRTHADLEAIFSATHELTFADPSGNPGVFLAVRRAGLRYS